MLKRNSIGKNASPKGSLTPNRSSSSNLSVNNMKVPLLVHSTVRPLATKQLPIRPSASSDTLNRTSDTFKSQPDGKPGTFSNLSTLQKRNSSSASSACRPSDGRPNAVRKKFYYDSQGHRIQVRNTIEDFLSKPDDEDGKPDDDRQSISTCSLRDSSLSLRQNWAKLPFY